MKCLDCGKTFDDDEIMWTFLGERKISYGQNSKTKVPKNLEWAPWRCRDCHLKLKNGKKADK